jgi:2-polyprenyl-6-methoxyphenol hydroxylase-like FAD-dependent oxidoreductase
MGQAPIHETDVAIIGGGLAGSAAAAMLGRAGVATTLIDPHAVKPPDFRCEKLDGSQVAALRRTGLADAVLAKGTLDHQVWVVRGGRVVDRKPHHQYNFLYDTMVNAMRAEVPVSVDTVLGKVTAVASSPDRQTLTLSTGDMLSARLMVFATGLNLGLRHTLGIGRQVISPNHSISIGFDIAPRGDGSFPFEALTYFSERAAARMAYLALFMIGPVMRANLFVYREMSDPWLEGFRAAPEDALLALMPNLRRLIGDFKVTSLVKIRPVDLVVTENHLQPGAVLIGDAFATSCPAAGTGCNKVFNDVALLCGTHVPRWLATPGMAADKIAAFYNDPEKLAVDAHSQAKAFALRALSTEPGVLWRARRRSRFYAHLALGTLRRLRHATHRPPPRDAAAPRARTSA